MVTLFACVSIPYCPEDILCTSTGICVVVLLDFGISFVLLFFFSPFSFDLVSAIHIYLTVLSHSQKNDLWLFLFDIPLRSAETLHFCCTQSARWETKNQKIKIHCLKLQVFSIVQWKKQTTTVKTRFHYTIIWRLSHDVD